METPLLLPQAIAHFTAALNSAGDVVRVVSNAVPSRWDWSQSIPLLVLKSVGGVGIDHVTAGALLTEERLALEAFGATDVAAMMLAQRAMRVAPALTERTGIYRYRIVGTPGHMPDPERPQVFRWVSYVSYRLAAQN